jgi:hypothetical protein
MLRRALLASSSLVLVLAACGNDGDSARASEQTTTSHRETTTTGSTTTTTTAPAKVATITTTTTAAPTPPTTARPAPPFAASIETVTAQDLYASWRPGCPVPVEQLRAIDVTHWGNDGAVHTGRLIVAADLAEGVVAVLHDLYDARFPVEKMQPIDVYGGDDNRSIKANNTSAFNCRAVTGGSGWSEHAYGRAIDVNPFVNPYVKGSTVLPPEAAPYADRSRHDQGMIHADDAVVRAFAARGWRWGGYWSSLKDYQHFSTTGR